MAETITDFYSLAAVLTGIILCFFYYVTHARREYRLLTGFLLGDFLSTYYWVVFAYVVGDYPDAAELMAYSGWNIGYVMLFLLALTVRDREARRFFHPLMLLPVPLNIAQFLLYIQFGGYFNNAWQGIFCTLIAVCSLQGILYRRSTGKRDGRGMISVALLLYVVFQYCAFTASCFTYPPGLPDPYLFFTSAQYAVNILLPVAVARMYGDRLLESKAGDEADFRNLLRVIFVALVIGISIAGYLLAGWMQSLLDTGTGDIPAESASRIIMIMLFVISVALSILVITVLIALRQGEQSLETAVLMEDRADEAGRTAAEEVTDREETLTASGPETNLIMRRWNLVLPLMISFLLLMLVVIYTSRQFYGVSVTKSREDALDKVSGTAEQLENYMDTAKSVLWVTADSVNYMLANGAADSHILRYLEQETENQQSQFDENYTGVYGYIRGLYMDGSGWEPPPDFVPVERGWYLAAMEAGGDVTIAQPYVDMQTGSVVISVCKQLKDSQGSALSLDLIIGYVQSVVEETDVSGMGYCMVLDSDGTVIAHRDPGMNGQDIHAFEYGPALIQNARLKTDGFFEMSVDGQMSTVFVRRVMNQWYTVIIIGNDVLFADVYRILVVNVLIFLVVFVLIAVFYSIAYRREERSSREAHTLRIREQQQSYEAEILRLEKQSADAANAAKSSFLADMSHEIRTPINAVLGMNEMILRESRDDRITTYARNLESAGKNLLSIINDILDFSKIEAGKMEIVEAPYRLSSVLNDVSNMIAFRARAKDLTFLVEVDETIPDNLNGDEVRVRQIITNILTNAVKYTPEGSVKLSVKAERVQPDRISLLVDVSDTGIGIKEEDIGNLFTKFGRVDLQQTNTIEGTGLGLAITENLLLMMKGNIRVESVYGEGSVFRLRIPQGVVSGEAIGDFHRRFEEGLKTLTAYRESFRAPDAHVLVVDDTELNLVVIDGLLKTTEVLLETAGGGEEALQKTQDTPFDLILLDQRMPHMSGSEVLKHIRAQEGGCNRETPVICLTADAVQGARDRYLKEGFSDYLSKPVEGPALEAALMNWLPAEKVLRTTPEKDGAAGTNETDAAPETEEKVPADNAAGMERVYASVSGLDLAEARKYLMTDDLLEKTLCQFYELLPENADEIERLYEDGDYENYTIRVHAMKSSAGLIGAAELSGLARRLEENGNMILDGKEEASGFLKEMTPKLLSSCRSLHDALAPFFEKKDVAEKDLPEMTKEALCELYDAILEFAEKYDLDGIGSLLSQTEAYAIPEQERERFGRIRKCVRDSDWSRLREMLQGSGN